MDAPWHDRRVAELIDLALREDLGAGDRTTEALVRPIVRARGRLLAKEPLVICGLPLVELVFGRLGQVEVRLQAEDGGRATHGQVLATVDGPARVLLAGERLVLNFLQHLSGIATLTHKCVERVAGTKLVVRDTRKTIPGLRLLAKYAVRVGGGANHRLRLDDAILIKDNHLALGGGDVQGAVARARAAFASLPLEIECRTLDELRLAVAAKPDLILLDLHMRKMNGVQVLKQIRARSDTNGTPVIAFSTVSASRLLEPLWDSGVNRFLAKDHFEPDLFIKLVRATLAPSAGNESV